MPSLKIHSFHNTSSAFSSSPLLIPSSIHPSIHPTGHFLKPHTPIRLLSGHNVNRLLHSSSSVHSFHSPPAPLDGERVEPVHSCVLPPGLPTSQHEGLQHSVSTLSVSEVMKCP
ncbi:hypothetical protein TcWFU_008958 [Taenia crassiceps]|uniref:Uncharacterized protein n=1 Tax=Taenia crassiceps TaxID=6207 RepID=A0ABR4Q8C4_9CEST